MVFTKKVIIDPIREIAFGSIGSSYTPIGSALEGPSKILFITNGTNQNVYISNDLQKDKFKLLPNSSQSIDISANRSEEENDDLLLEKGSILYVKHEGIAPTSGSVWIEILRREIRE
jgi:hypothetical protein